jgi:hypothetical protein
VKRGERSTDSRRPQLDLAEAERRIRAALEEEDTTRSDVTRFVLAYGTAHRPVERPADVAPGIRHQAFRNAYRLARERPDLSYCEGFTLPRGWTDRPNRHAWCLDGGGTVIDPSPTWADPGKPLRDCYFGVAIPLEFAAPHADGDGAAPTRGVLYELTGRMHLLAAELGVDPV